MDLGRALAERSAGQKDSVGRFLGIQGINALHKRFSRLRSLPARLGQGCGGIAAQAYFPRAAVPDKPENPPASVAGANEKIQAATVAMPAWFGKCRNGTG